jgi:hypothetical protein
MTDAVGRPARYAKCKGSLGMPMAVRFFHNSLIAMAVFLTLSVADAQAKEIPCGLFGVWGWDSLDKGLAMLSENNFQVMVTYPDKRILDKAYSRGIKCIVSMDLSKEQATNSSSWNSYLAELKSTISRYKNHPAVLAWFPIDEADGKGIPVDRIKTIRQTIKSLDCSHPIFSVVSAPAKWRPYLMYFDMVSVDPYLLRYKDGTADAPTKVKTYLTALKEDLKTLKLSRPVWVTLGAFDQKQKNPSNFAPYKKPTNEEFDQMVAMSLTEKVSGILIYTFASRGDAEVTEWKMPNDPLWNAVKKVPATIKRSTAP